MNLEQTSPRSALGTAAVLLSPLALLGGLLLAIAVGHDFLYFAGETPVALGLCAPAAYLLLRWFVPYAVAKLREGSPISTAEAGAD
jgi:hypothetical protein